MTVDQHHRAHNVPAVSRPRTAADPAQASAEQVAGLRVRRVRYEPDLAPPGPDYVGPDDVGPDDACPDGRVASWRGPVTVEVPQDPAARAAAGHLLLLVVEVLNRRRPAAQLAEAAVPSVVRYVRVATPARGLVQVASLHVRMPCDGAAEIVAVCRFGTGAAVGYRVVAARLDRCRAGWRCTTLRLL